MASSSQNKLAAVFFIAAKLAEAMGNLNRELRI
jgi:hypothetical protein